MIKVAIVGATGSGKSIATAIFETHGYYAINVDKLAKHILASDTKLITEMKIEFGDGAYSKFGEYQATHVSAIVFTDPEKLKRLNEIVFPYIRNRLIAQMDEVEIYKDAEYLVVEGAVLMELGINSRFDYVVEIESDEYLRLRRIMNRSRLSESEAYSRIRLQKSVLSSLPDASKSVVNNTGSLESFIIKIGTLAEDIKNKVQ